jgi:hypothetical protein
MKKLFALARVFVIVVVAVLPGIGAAFQVIAGAPPARPPSAKPEGCLELVGTYVAMQPGMEEGALMLGFARTTTPLPPGAAPALDMQ